MLKSVQEVIPYLAVNMNLTSQVHWSICFDGGGVAVVVLEES
jgi:hypothetical protein